MSDWASKDGVPVCHWYVKNPLLRKDSIVIVSEHKSCKRWSCTSSLICVYLLYCTLQNQTAFVNIGQNKIAAVHNLTHSACTMHSTLLNLHPPLTRQVLLSTQETSTRHGWQNSSRCRDGVKVLWCCSHLAWFDFMLLFSLRKLSQLVINCICTYSPSSESNYICKHKPETVQRLGEQFQPLYVRVCSSKALSASICKFHAARRGQRWPYMHLHLITWLYQYCLLVYDCIHKLSFC